jgi:hypothetical protein
MFIRSSIAEVQIPMGTWLLVFRLLNLFRNGPQFVDCFQLNPEKQEAI